MQIAVQTTINSCEKIYNVVRTGLIQMESRHEGASHSRMRSVPLVIVLELFKVAATFHVPQPQEKQRFSRLAGRHTECANYFLNGILELTGMPGFLEPFSVPGGSV